MKKRIATALGVLALSGWLAGSAIADGEVVQSVPVTSAPPMVVSEAPTVQGGNADDPAGVHIYGGAGLYYLKAYPGGNVATTTSTSTSTSTPGAPGSGIEDITAFQADVTFVDFGQQYKVAPLVWLGIENDAGLGARVRWWRLDDSAKGVVIPSFGGVFFTPVTPGTATEANKIKLNVWDFEGTMSQKEGPWSFLVGAGARWAMLSQVNTTHLDGPTGFPVFIGGGEDDVGDDILTTNIEDLAGSNTFNGLGPTVALEVKRQIGETNLTVYANARVSLLFGHKKLEDIRIDHAQTTEAEAGDEAHNFISIFADHHDTLSTVTVGEIELGTEWSQNMGSFTPFLRGGVIAQSWIDAGNAVNTSGTLGLFGFTAQAGVNF